MNITFNEGVAFCHWLEERGLAPSSFTKEKVFSNNFVVLDTEMYEKFLAENAGKPFVPGVVIESRRVKNLKIAVDFNTYKKFRVLKHYSGVWYLMGLGVDGCYNKLTTLSNHQMIKLLGEHFEENYYEEIYRKA